MLKDKNGYDIPEWRIEADKKQKVFAERMDAITKALEAEGHTGWYVEHVVDNPQDKEYYAGLDSYYGTCTIKCIHDIKVDGMRPENFSICVWMSEKRKRGVKEDRAYFCVSHGELEKYSRDSDESIKAGVSITRTPKQIAAEIIRRVILPARIERGTLEARRKIDRERRVRIVALADKLVKASNNGVVVEFNEQRWRDKNVGAELRYYVYDRIDIDGKIGYYGNSVDLTLKSLTPEQAATLLEIIASSLPA